MRVAAVVLTFNAERNDRNDLLERTLTSLGEADWLSIVDNGSTDGTAERVRAMGGWASTDPVTTSFHGTSLCARVGIGSGCDLVVLSDDDMEWRPGWRDRLAAWWADAPADVKLTGCHLEPVFPWNAITDSLDCGGVAGLVRESTGAASWSFRAADWSDLAPVFTHAPFHNVQGWGDVPACDMLRDAGWRIAQIDLAEHIGQGASSWGNVTQTKYGWDVEPVRQLLGARL